MPPITRIATPFTYSSAVAAGEWVFIGLHRGFGETFVGQIDGAIEGIGATLAQLGLSLDHVVKVHVWLKRIGDLPEMEKRFAHHFHNGYPARMTATTEFIDADCLVMVEGTAYAGR